MSQAALRHMLERGTGRNINLSSIVGEVGNIGQTNYAALKSGLLGLTKSVALEVAFLLGHSRQARRPSPPKWSGLFRTRSRDNLCDKIPVNGSAESARRGSPDGNFRRKTHFISLPVAAISPGSPQSLGIDESLPGLHAAGTAAVTFLFQFRVHYTETVVMFFSVANS